MGLLPPPKEGSLEKTVGASRITLWCVLSSLFFVEKTTSHNLLPLQVIVHFYTKKD